MQQKKAFTVVEVVFVFILILVVTFLILPKSLNNTKQAKFISKWSETYTQLEYMFSVIKAQQNGELEEKIKNAKDNEERKNILLETIKPYLRITTAIDTDYQQHYMNKSLVQESDNYYFANLYNTSSEEIVGLKWLKDDCGDKDVCAIINIDLNGNKSPNTWGYDIYGINLYKNKIEPIGKDMDMDTLKSNCSKNGYGIYCSYYYLIGGKFE